MFPTTDVHCYGANQLSQFFLRPTFSLAPALQTQVGSRPGRPHILIHLCLLAAYPLWKTSIGLVLSFLGMAFLKKTDKSMFSICYIRRNITALLYHKGDKS